MVDRALDRLRLRVGRGGEAERRGRSERGGRLPFHSAISSGRDAGEHGDALELAVDVGERGGEPAQRLALAGAGAAGDRDARAAADRREQLDRLDRRSSAPNAKRSVGKAAGSSSKRTPSETSSAGVAVDRVDAHERREALRAARRAHGPADAVAVDELAAAHLRRRDVDVVVGRRRRRRRAGSRSRSAAARRRPRRCAPRPRPRRARRGHCGPGGPRAPHDRGRRAPRERDGPRAPHGAAAALGARRTVAALVAILAAALGANGALVALLATAAAATAAGRRRLLLDGLLGSGDRLVAGFLVGCARGAPAATAARAGALRGVLVSGRSRGVVAALTGEDRVDRSSLRRRRKPSMPSSEAIACRSASGLSASAERSSTGMWGSSWGWIGGLRPRWDSGRRYRNPIRSAGAAPCGA